MESTHVIAIPNGEENIGHMKENNTLKFPLPPIISHLRKNEIHCSMVSTTSNLREKQKKSEDNTRKMIHSIKVGISLVLVSLLYLLNPLFEQVGENAMWAIMTVIVIFEFSAGATLGKGFNRGIGTIVGGALGCLAAFFAQSIGIGSVANSIIIAISVFILGSITTYVRLVPRIKKRYDYGVMIFLLTFNLVVVSGVRANMKVWEIARERLVTILMGFIVCICVSLLVFPLWASDELHHSIVSRLFDLADTIQGWSGECTKVVSEKENQPARGASASFNVCKSVLNSKSKDESLANFAKWEPWHGKFGFSYPWERYLKIGEVLRDLAAFILAVGQCIQASKQSMDSLRQSQSTQLETCDAIVSRVVCIMRELGNSMKQMRKCEARANISAQLKAARAELSLVISKSKIAEFEDDQVLAIASFVFLLVEVVGKVEELVKEVEELGDNVGLRTPSPPMRKMGIPKKCVSIAIGLLCMWSVVDSIPDTTITNVLCNNGEYTFGDPFANSLSYVFMDLEKETPAQKNYDYYNISPYPNAFAYGHAACNLNLTSSGCKTCLGVAKTALFNTCQTPRIGARSVLHDCAIRYEQYPFDN
ncbi:hypothetical protein VNO77_17286 [Canavalia gladiata]|uniref:Gnk2-homologous domain-containing protein n=1 Tax=Canavalia gladiata TaxID=3824 RepID=A0AAN9QGG9_CANGL